jgi:hypothetical protein
MLADFQKARFDFFTLFRSLFCRASQPGLPDGFVFKQKIQIWVNFGGSCNGRCWCILWILGPFHGLLLYFMDIWYI